MKNLLLETLMRELDSVRGLTDPIRDQLAERVADGPTAALLLARSAVATERGIELCDPTAGVTARRS